MQHGLEFAVANPVDQLLGFFAGTVGDAEDLHLIEVDPRPHDLADVAAAGTGDGEPRIAVAGLHVEDHGVDEAVGHLAADQVHDRVDGGTAGHGLDLFGEVAHVGAVEHRLGAEVQQGLGLVALAQA